MVEHLKKFGVFDTGEMHTELGACHVLRYFRMGLGTGAYHLFPYDGESAVVVEPELAGVLDYFDIDHEEFMDDCPSHEHNG